MHLSFMAAAFCYIISLALMIGSRRRASAFFMGLGCSLNLLSLGVRYYGFFPMLPLYQGAYLIPCLVGACCIKPILASSGHPIHPLMVSSLALTALFFPNDYYLPVLQFKTPFAHAFVFFGVVGKAMFFMAGTWAFLALIRSARQSRERSWQTSETGDETESIVKSQLVASISTSENLKKMGNAVILGFFFWTLSIFSGAVWSYLGWGSPVVWDDPLMTTTMAVWLYFTLFLHLHLIPTLYKPFPRAMFALVGSALVFVGTLMPELGMLRWPGGLS